MHLYRTAACVACSIDRTKQHGLLGQEGGWPPSGLNLKELQHTRAQHGTTYSCSTILLKHAQVRSHYGTRLVWPLIHTDYFFYGTFIAFSGFQKSAEMHAAICAINNARIYTISIDYDTRMINTYIVYIDYVIL